MLTSTAPPRCSPGSGFTPRPCGVHRHKAELFRCRLARACAPPQEHSTITLHMHLTLPARWILTVRVPCQGVSHWERDSTEHGSVFGCRRPRAAAQVQFTTTTAPQPGCPRPPARCMMPMSNGARVRGQCKSVVSEVVCALVWYGSRVSVAGVISARRHAFWVHSRHLSSVRSEPSNLSPLSRSTGLRELARGPITAILAYFGPSSRHNGFECL